VSELPRGTVTFLFTDVEGSTKLLDALGGVSYHEVLTTHQRLLREVFAVHGGREIDTHGDSFFVAFQRAAEAVQAAIEGQRALAGHDWPAGVGLRVRIGIDTGEPTIGGDRYVGLGVHRSARIMAAGHGGQILVSGTTRDLIVDELPAGTSLRDLGPRRLKDIERPVHLYQVTAPGLATEFAPLKTVDSKRPQRLMLAGGAVLAAAAIAIAFLLLRGGSSPIVVSPNSLGVIDLGSNKVVKQIPVGDTPTSVEVGAGDVWVLNANEQTLKEIDPVRRVILRTIGVGAAPTGLALGRDAVWVSSGTRTVTEIDPGEGGIDRSFSFPLASTNPLATGEASSTIGAGANEVWAATAATAARIEPGPVRSHPVADFGCCRGIALGDGSVWVTDGQGVVRLNQRTGAVEARTALTFAPQDIAVGAGGVWVTDQLGDTVWHIDPRTDLADRSITVGENPAGIAIGDGSVWVASGDGTVSRIDPRSELVTATIDVGGTPQDVAVGAGAAWVTVD
jgi:class 3 adenylate cyclase/streptogramin lyase